MDFSTKITIMGRNGAELGEAITRAAQKFFDGNTIFMQDVKSFAVAVTGRADGGKVSHLHIIDHGNEEGCWFGNDHITAANFENYVPYLSKVSRFFTPSSIVHLGHCRMGQNPALMHMFALTFGVRVYAGTGDDRAQPFNFNKGDYVGCTPAGTMFKEMRRP